MPHRAGGETIYGVQRMLALYRRGRCGHCDARHEAIAVESLGRALSAGDARQSLTASATACAPVRRGKPISSLSMRL
jgi:hypothetical protein